MQVEMVLTYLSLDREGWMRRREFIAGLGGAVAWPPVARGQQAAMPVIGRLYSGHPTAATPKANDAFLRGLREQGYTEGRNVMIEDRFAGNQYDRLPPLRLTWLAAASR
jgi:putative tryptophan/tyrosine transport system substrate-binding protein